MCVSSHATATDECVTLVSNARMIGVPHRLPYITPLLHTHTDTYIHIYIHILYINKQENLIYYSAQLVFCDKQIVNVK